VTSPATHLTDPQGWQPWMAPVPTGGQAGSRVWGRDLTGEVASGRKSEPNSESCWASAFAYGELASDLLIHMNGRVYDYRLGRFLSVDPIISNPLSSQSINPYSYIGNNPLSGTDPTGYECVKVTGSNICNANPIGNVTINGNHIPNNVVSGPATSGGPAGGGGPGSGPSNSGAVGARPTQHGSDPVNAGSTTEVNKQNSSGQGPQYPADFNITPNPDPSDGFSWNYELKNPAGPWGAPEGASAPTPVLADAGNPVPSASEMRLPTDPGGLGPEWTHDPTHQDPNGERYRDPDGRTLDWHKGREGQPGWKGKDHWHDDGGKKHLPPGTEVPDPAPLPSGARRALVGGAAAVGAGYLIYRGVRMVPSLLPPLWWTIPANAAVP